MTVPTVSVSAVTQLVCPRYGLSCAPAFRARPLDRDVPAGREMASYARTRQIGRANHQNWVFPKSLFLFQ